MIYRISKISLPLASALLIASVVSACSNSATPKKSGEKQPAAADMSAVKISFLDKNKQASGSYQFDLSKNERVSVEIAVEGIDDHSVGIVSGPDGAAIESGKNFVWKNAQNYNSSVTILIRDFGACTQQAEDPKDCQLPSNGDASQSKINKNYDLQKTFNLVVIGGVEEKKETASNDSLSSVLGSGSNTSSSGGAGGLGGLGDLTKVLGGAGGAGGLGDILKQLQNGGGGPNGQGTAELEKLLSGGGGQGLDPNLLAQLQKLLQQNKKGTVP